MMFHSVVKVGLSLVVELVMLNLLVVVYPRYTPFFGEGGAGQVC